jgi:radical SAM family protein
MSLTGYPRPVTSIHQIEVTSRCNLRCVYCPSRHLDKPIDKGGFGRAKQDITLANFKRALLWAIHFDERGTQGELALTGIGEATMHPQFVEMLRLAREVLPDNPITFSTNGLLLTEELVQAVAPYRPLIYVSLHRPEKAKPAIDIANRYGLLAEVNAAFALNAFDWAGGLDWDVTVAEGSVVCEYLRTGWSVVLSDGRITTCCLDAEGAGVVGHVDDEIGSLSIQPWEGVKQGCESCHMVVP